MASSSSHAQIAKVLHFPRVHLHHHRLPRFSTRLHCGLHFCHKPGKLHGTPNQWRAVGMITWWPPNSTNNLLSIIYSLILQTSSIIFIQSLPLRNKSRRRFDTYKPYSCHISHHFFSFPVSFPFISLVFPSLHGHGQAYFGPSDVAVTTSPSWLFKISSRRSSNLTDVRIGQVVQKL